MLKRKGYIIGGIIFSAILGILLHFVYEWSGYNKTAGYFSAVNESTWEHLKLLFFPVLIFSLFEWLKVKKEYPAFLLSRTISLILGMIWIVVSFYTISGIVGKIDMPVINIGIFILGVIITFMLTQTIIKSIFNTPKYADGIALIILFIILIMFLIWTYNPPNIGLFKKP